MILVLSGFHYLPFYPPFRKMKTCFGIFSVVLKQEIGRGKEDIQVPYLCYSKPWICNKYSAWEKMILGQFYNAKTNPLDSTFV